MNASQEELLKSQNEKLAAIEALIDAAFRGELYTLPGGYPSRPVEAFDLRAALRATSGGA